MNTDTDNISECLELFEKAFQAETADYYPAIMYAYQNKLQEIYNSLNKQEQLKFLRLVSIKFPNSAIAEQFFAGEIESLLNQ